MIQHNKYGYLALGYVCLAGSACFSVYGFASPLGIVNSVVSLSGSVVCLAGYAKFAYHIEKED